MDNNKINWCMVMHVNGRDMHSRLYRAEVMGRGVQMEIHTPVSKHGKFGKSRVYFFIDGDKREFRTEEELINAIKEVVHQ